MVSVQSFDSYMYHHQIPIDLALHGAAFPYSYITMLHAWWMIHAVNKDTAYVKYDSLGLSSFNKTWSTAELVVQRLINWTHVDVLCVGARN
jgi:hypothetical protein